MSAADVGNRLVVEHGLDVGYDPVVDYPGPLDGINLVASEIVSSYYHLRLCTLK